VSLEKDLFDANGELEGMNEEFSVERRNFGDADLYEISEKKNAQLSKLDSQAKEVGSLLEDMESSFAYAKENGDDVSAIEPKLEQVRSDFGPNQEKLAKVHELTQELLGLI